MVLTDGRIVITGGAGFLGRYVRRELEKTVPHENILIPLFYDYDLTNQNDVVRMYRDMRPTVVIHLAADFGGIGYNTANPGLTFHSNLAMGLHLVEYARVFGVKKFVQAGSVCSYPKNAPLPFNEDNLWDGYPDENNAPYGIAKKAISAMLPYYRKQYGFNGISIMLTNLYGCCDDFSPEASHVIPALIKKFSEAVEARSDEVAIWGTGTASRDFLHVEDAARGIVLATKGYDGYLPVNLATGVEVTIKEVTEKLKDISGFKGKLVWDSTKPDGQPRRVIDNKRAKLFGFTAEKTFDKELESVYNWWNDNDTISNSLYGGV